MEESPRSVCIGQAYRDSYLWSTAARSRLSSLPSWIANPQCKRPPFRAALRRNSLDSLFQYNGHDVACLLPNCLAKLGSHWQLVPAVPQGHKGASEWMSINLAPDLNQTASTKKLHRATPDYITPTPLLGAFL